MRPPASFSLLLPCAWAVIVGMRPVHGPPSSWRGGMPSPRACASAPSRVRCIHYPSSRAMRPGAARGPRSPGIVGEPRAERCRLAATDEPAPMRCARSPCSATLRTAAPGLFRAPTWSQQATLRLRRPVDLHVFRLEPSAVGATLGQRRGGVTPQPWPAFAPQRGRRAGRRLPNVGRTRAGFDVARPRPRRCEQRRELRPPRPAPSRRLTPARAAVQTEPTPSPIRCTHATSGISAR